MNGVSRETSRAAAVRSDSTPDTIFALSSGAGRAAVAVMRISGAGCQVVIARLAGLVPPPRMAQLVRLRCPTTGETLDHALVLWFPGPRSYTGEDAAELHLHGSPAVVAGVAGALVELGARPAEPGEFTRRAFLNGKLDLTAAEGVADLIAAETAAQRRQALQQAEGGLAKLVDDWAGRLTRLLAHQEAAIEFSDEDLPTDLDQQARAGARALRAEIAAHLEDQRQGERLRAGIMVAIVGAPNAGKSSLLNALVGREAAIVSARAGTTRDIIEARLDLGGIPVTMADTAGLREVEGDEVEAEGVRRALRRTEQADLLLAVFVAGMAPDAATLGLLKRKRCEVVAVTNKIDLAAAPATVDGLPILAVSARTGEGLAALRDRLTTEAVRLAGTGAAAMLTRPRHRAALAETAVWLGEAEATPLPELTAEALRAALRALGRLTGRVGVESVLDLVFADFCIGK